MKRKLRIVIVEDEPDIVEIIRYHLAREGFEVSSAADGERGLQMVRATRPDLVLLDLLLPGLDGLEVCRELKTDPMLQDMPVVMVTAKSEESDVVLGLGLGADDYLTKPFSPRELVARVRAVLRRSQRAPGTAPAERVVRGALVVDAAAHEVEVAEQPVELTATEFRLLYFLASNPGRVFTRDQLISRVIGENVAVVDRNIDVHVRAVRRKLGEHRQLIETVRGVGYRFRQERAED